MMTRQEVLEFLKELHSDLNDPENYEPICMYYTDADREKLSAAIEILEKENDGDL